MSQRLFWQNLYPDIQKYSESCDICQRTEINYRKRTVPLHPFALETTPFAMWHIDHNTLPRVTKEGSVAILCVIDSFTEFPVIAPVKDLSAETSAKTFVKEVVSIFGVPRFVVTDSGSSFTAAFFKEVTRILGVKQILSATSAAHTNGLCENLCKKVSQGIKLYAKNDLEIEAILPIVAMGLRASVYSLTTINPYEAAFGRVMPIGQQSSEQLGDKFQGTAKEYKDFIYERLKELHKGVASNIADAKAQDKKGV